jgi:putative addiction module killer protein
VTGHPGDAKPVGGGVTEMRIQFGPGYRVYYAAFEQTVVLLGGDKSTQTRDVRTAQHYAKIWKETQK